MMMNNVLFGLFLGLLAVVQMTPVPSVTEIPAKAEEDVLREAVTDGFLVNFFTTESPKTNAPASQQPPSDPKEAVTEVPTEEPTEEPTQETIADYTEEPSEEPTEEPTQEPSEEPSEESSEEPTEVPTQEPTEEPIADYTEEPSEEPTEKPTQEPSEEPSEEPTEEPTEESTTAVFIQHGGDHNPTSTDSSTTHSSPSGPTPTSVPNDAEPSTTPHAAAAQTTDPAVSSFLSTLSSDSGSGDGEVFDQDATTSSSTTPVSSTDSSSTASTSTAAFIHLFEDVEGSSSGSTEETSAAPSTSTAILFQSTTPALSSASSATNETAMNETSLADNSIGKSGRMLPGVGLVNPLSPQGAASSTTGLQISLVENPSPPKQLGTSTTPGWIIILGFIVGVAMLVMLCVAIATRDKWNGPRKVTEAETKAGSSDQQRGQEMETFMPKDEPMENGRSEYTVIPLEELPESYSSH